MLLVIATVLVCEILVMINNSLLDWSNTLVWWTAGMLLVIITVAICEVLVMDDNSPLDWSDTLVWWTAGMLLGSPLLPSVRSLL